MALMEIETLKKAGTCDIISNLPQEVIDTILVHLPIREAVRTSILSSEWRDKWLTISQLRFDESITSRGARKKKLISIVYAILLRHRGPICRFELSNHYSPTCFDLDQWIILLAKNGKIQELSLDFETGHEGFYIVHSLLFSCQQLTYLKLSNCLITPTPIFKGFNSLTSLHLDQVTIDDNILESLILNSPLLERITLSSIICYSFLKISGPNLKHLELQGNFKDICLENNPHLATVSIELFAETKLHARHELRRTCNLVRVLSCIPSVERLSLSGDFLKFLAISNVPDSLPIRYNHLKVLELYVLNFNNLDEISVAVSIMRSAPQLEELSIWTNIGHYRDDNERHVMQFLKEKHQLNFSFDKLHVVEMYSLSTRSEMEFIKFILAHSPTLREMVINHRESVLFRDPRVFKDLLLFERASPRVQFRFS